MWTSYSFFFFREPSKRSQQWSKQWLVVLKWGRIPARYMGIKVRHYEDAEGSNNIMEFHKRFKFFSTSRVLEWKTGATVKSFFGWHSETIDKEKALDLTCAMVFWLPWLVINRIVVGFIMMVYIFHTFPIFLIFWLKKEQTQKPQKSTLLPLKNGCFEDILLPFWGVFHSLLNFQRGKELIERGTSKKPCPICRLLDCIKVTLCGWKSKSSDNKRWSNNKLPIMLQCHNMYFSVFF